MEPRDPTPTDQLEPWPYDLSPSVWRRGVLPWAVLVVVASVALAGLVVAFRKGDWAQVVGTVMFFGPVICFVLSMPERRDRAAGSFRLVAPEADGTDPAPIDDWLHVAGLRLPRRVQIVAMGWASLGLVCVTIAATAQLLGLVPRWNPDTTTAQLVIAVVLCLAFSSLFVWVTWALVARRRTSVTDGRGSVGVGLGEHAVRVDVPGRRVNLRWDDIVEIEATHQQPNRPRFPGERPQLHMIRIQSNDALPKSQQVQLIAVTTCQVPVQALWTALRWYHAHPQARWELGRAEGTARLERWCRAAVPAAPGAWSGSSTSHGP